MRSKRCAVQNEGITLSDFLKKLLVERNTKINIKRNGIVTLPWRLRLQ